MPDRDALKAFPVPENKPNQNEMQVFCSTLANRLNTTKANLASWEQAYTGAVNGWNAAIDGGLTELPTALQAYGMDPIPLTTFISDLDGVVSKFTSVTSPFMKFVPALCKTLGSFVAGLNVITGVIEFFNPTPSQSEVALAQISNQLNVIFDHLLWIESALENISNRMEYLNVQFQQTSYDEVRAKLANWRSNLIIKANNLLSSHDPNALSLLMDAANSIDNEIDSVVDRYITLAITSFDAYLGYLQSFSQSDPPGAPGLVADKAALLAPIPVGMKLTISESIRRKHYSNNALTTTSTINNVSAFTFPTTTAANSIPNPNMRIPFSLDALEYLHQIMLFRLSLVDYLAMATETREGWKSDLAKQYLTDSRYIPKLRSDVEAAYAQLKTEMDAIHAKILAYKNTCTSSLNAINFWFGPEVQLYDEQSEETGNWKTYYSWMPYKLTALSEGAFYLKDTTFSIFNPPRCSFSGDLASQNAATLNVIQWGMPEPKPGSFKNSYTGIITIGVNRVFGAVELFLADQSLGSLTGNYSDPDFWDRLEAIAKTDYLSRSSKLLDFASRLAGLEMMLETYICK